MELLLRYLAVVLLATAIARALPDELIHEDPPQQLDRWTWGNLHANVAYDKNPYEGTEALPAGHPGIKPSRRALTAVRSNAAPAHHYEPIRIVTENQFSGAPCQATEEKSSENECFTHAKATFFNDVLMPRVKHVLQSVLRVFPASGPIGVPVYCTSSWTGQPNSPRRCHSTKCSFCKLCGEANVPTHHLNGEDQYGGTKWCTKWSDTSVNNTCTNHTRTQGGVANADLLIYLLADGSTSSCRGNSVAYASSCASDQFDRPTVGYINFCPQLVGNVSAPGYADSLDYKFWLDTTLHEIAHILGISKTKFSLFRDHATQGMPRTARHGTSGLPPNGAGNTTIKHSWERNHAVSKLVTPTVVRTARAQFGCATLDGAEIENHGGSGSAGSHLEQRIFGNDFMTASADVGSRGGDVLTHVAFAILQDSGWYHVNFSSPFIQVGTWLRDAGCAAVTENCITNGTVVKGGEGFFTSILVNDELESTCSSDLLHYQSLIKVKEYTITNVSNPVISDPDTLPTEYQYFANPAIGGSFAGNDYCPYLKGYPSRRCRDITESSTSWKEDSYSNSSICLKSNIKRADGVLTEGCYASACTPNGKLEIHFAHEGTDQSVFVCEYKNQQISVPRTLYGTYSFICPDPGYVCPHESGSNELHISAHTTTMQYWGAFNETSILKETMWSSMDVSAPPSVTNEAMWNAQGQQVPCKHITFDSAFSDVNGHVTLLDYTTRHTVEPEHSWNEPHNRPLSKGRMLKLQQYPNFGTEITVKLRQSANVYVILGGLYQLEEGDLGTWEAASFINLPSTDIFAQVFVDQGAGFAAQVPGLQFTIMMRPADSIIRKVRIPKTTQASLMMVVVA